MTTNHASTSARPAGTADVGGPFGGQLAEPARCRGGRPAMQPAGLACATAQMPAIAPPTGVFAGESDLSTWADTAAIDVYPLVADATPDAFCSGIEHWQRLWHESDRPNVLQAPAVCRADLRRTIVRSGEAGPGPHGAFIHVRCEAGECAAVVLPKRMTAGEWGIAGLPVRLNGFRLAGNSVFGTGDPATAALCLRAAMHWSTAQRGRFLLLEDVEADSPMWRLAFAAAGRRAIVPRGVAPRHWIRFPRDPAEYWSRFTSKTRNTFRRKRKRFPQLRWRVYRRPSEVADFTRVAHVVSRRTWQTRQLGLRIHDDAAEREWLRAIAEAGGLRAYVLFSGQEPAAFLLGFQTGGTFIYEEVGYAEPFGRYSAGQVLLLEVLEDLFAHDSPERLDFGAGDADYKRLFANETTASGHVTIVPGAVLRPALRLLTGATRRLRLLARHVRDRRRAASR